MKNAFAWATVVVSFGCSSGHATSNDDGGATSSGGNTATGGTPGASGAAGSGAGAAAGANSGSGGSAGPDAGSGAAGASSGPWDAGYTPGACKAGLPAEAKAVDTSKATPAVGRGTAASCDFASLKAAVEMGGVVTFDCGDAPVTIAVTSTLSAPTDKDTVIDGGRRVTLDGKSQVELIRFDSPGWQTNEHRLTLQHIALVNAKTTPMQAIPKAPPPCSQGFDDGQGGAVYMRDGNLTVVDAIFSGNQAAPLGPDTGGGAIYVQGSKHGVVIASSTFQKNTGSNGGAVGGLFAELHVYESRFSQNTAVGSGANNDDASMCSAMNNGQHEIGSGGNGGALYSDGNSVNVVLCGDEITGNAAGMAAFGGGLFFTSNNMQGTLSIADTTMTGNTGGHWTNVSTGSVKSAGSAVGTNCKSITVQDSTLQD